MVILLLQFVNELVTRKHGQHDNTKQFLKNYNMTWLVRHKYDTPNEVSVFPKCTFHTKNHHQLYLSSAKTQSSHTIQVQS